MRVSIMKLFLDFSLPKPKPFIAGRGEYFRCFWEFLFPGLHVRGLYEGNTTTTGNWLVVCVKGCLHYEDGCG